MDEYKTVHTINHQIGDRTSPRRLFEVATDELATFESQLGQNEQRLRRRWPNTSATSVRHTTWHVRPTRGSWQLLSLGSCGRQGPRESVVVARADAVKMRVSLTRSDYWISRG